MQFVPNGPDLPDDLLRAHEDGQVVFFCGAGISYPAGLPGFKGLVNAVCDLLGTQPTGIEAAALNRNAYDAALDLLERRIPGQRFAVRKAVAAALQPNLDQPHATDTHAALLQLGRDRRGRCRLVTTNFDRIFEHVKGDTGIDAVSLAAPLLPIPKVSRWDGLVYLHGLLPANDEEAELNRLVLTSGDFGLAYLTERWAARFVTDLFRNFLVCFVGYSIDDPVLRYMMDALAADRMLGEAVNEAYAFASYETDEKAATRLEWEAKGVSPILYEVPAQDSNHSLLHESLKAWSETYRDGLLGRERIVQDYAKVQPSTSTQQDDFVGRMLWALSHPSGIPAKRFAEFDPVPSLDWLEVLSIERFEWHDLKQFNVHPTAFDAENLPFSLVRRPPPLACAPWMSLVSAGPAVCGWDAVMFQIGRWLVKHLDNPSLVLWLVKQGGRLHGRFLQMIESAMDDIACLEKDGNTAELEAIRAKSPDAIPRPAMRRVWNLILVGKMKVSWSTVDAYAWKMRFARDGLTPLNRMKLMEILAPCASFDAPFQWSDGPIKGDPNSQVENLFQCELALAVDHAFSWLHDLRDLPAWREALPALLDDLQRLLHDALDLLRELGKATDKEDDSHIDLPSISPHWQNRGFHDWVVLIEMLRDAWIEVYSVDKSRAAHTARSWFTIPYPAFKRLALFATCHKTIANDIDWVEWLGSDGAWWLWAQETRREVMRLLVLQGGALSLRSRGQVEKAILDGPPRSMYREDGDPADWTFIRDRAVWLRLAKLQLSGVELGADAIAKLDELSKAHPNWALDEDERDEFVHWMSGTGDPDFERENEPIIVPTKRTELVEWLKRPRESPTAFRQDNWQQTCRNRFLRSVVALRDVAAQGVWPIECWNDALQAWSDESIRARSWHYSAQLVRTMPDFVIEKVAHSLSWWLRAVSKSAISHEEIFFELCGRVLAGMHDDGAEDDNPLFRAINHPTGRVTDALLNRWFQERLTDNAQLPRWLTPLLTQICDSPQPQFRHGRVVLASHLIVLFRVDARWTESHLLPHFGWAEDPREARRVWEGFLWSPRLYEPLLTAMKQPFLNTVLHYSELGERGRSFAAILAYAALERPESFTPQDFRTAIQNLPQEGLENVARTLFQALQAAGDQREEYWAFRIVPFWNEVWPKSLDRLSDGVAESLARLSIAAGPKFPDALSLVRDWLRPLQHPDFAVEPLHESGLAKHHPELVLELLNKIVNLDQFAPLSLAKCLVDIAKAAPELSRDYRFQALDEFARTRGI